MAELGSLSKFAIHSTQATPSYFTIRQLKPKSSAYDPGIILMTTSGHHFYSSVTLSTHFLQRLVFFFGMAALSAASVLMASISENSMFS
jgi:hypothetical protein